MSKEKLTKAMLIENVSGITGLARKDVQSVVDHILIQLKSALASDQVIEFRGFGTFKVRIRKGRDEARNPKTGQTVSVKDHGVVTFRPGKELKESVWPLS